MELENELPLKHLGPILLASTIVVVIVGFAISYAKKRPSTIVLPGGITYLGPSPTPADAQKFSAVMSGTIPIPNNAVWTDYKGKILPYSFSYPTTVSLGVFPNDPYDSVTVFYSGTDSQNNLFFRVEDLNQLNKQEWVNKPKLDYVNEWWKDYSWTGVSSVTAFTNSKGLSGFRAKYLNDKNVVPYDHVFFEVPGKPNLVIWISGKLFSQTVLDRLVDSVSWTK